MTDCFDSIVTLREYCTPETPFSGTYLNDIGLSKKQIEDIITGDFATVRSLVEATIRTEAKAMASEVYGYFAKSIKPKSLIENGNTGYPAKTKELLTASGDVVGVKIDLKNTANFMNIEVKSLSLFLGYTGNVTIQFIDLDTDEVLDSVVIATTSGDVIEQTVNKLYASSKRPRTLFIGYNSTGIAPYRTIARESVCCGNYGRSTPYTHIHGWNYTTGQSVQHTSGLGLQYSLACDQYGWLCPFSRTLSLPLAYKVAAEIYRRGLMVSPSVRSNNTTNTNSDLMTANMNWHLMKYQETFGNIIKSVHLPTSSVCYQCDSPVRHAIVLP